MKISEKIAQIRLEPEHIRLRYVWGSVAVSMLVILAIWIFSIGSLFAGDKNAENQSASSAPGLGEQLQTLKEQAPSITNLTDQTSNLGSEGVASTNSTVDPANPTGTTGSIDSTIPQTSAYSDLTTTPAQ